MIEELLFLFGVVLAINLLPAFGPPTWSIIMLFGLNTDLPLPALVCAGALGAALGRFLLAHGFRFWGQRIPERFRDNLAAVRIAFERHPRNSIMAFALFILSPLPSAQLFAAVGLAGTRLLPFTIAFFAGRLVTYSLYAGSARLVEDATLTDAFREVLTSPLGIALQLVMLAGLVILPLIDWGRILRVSRDEIKGEK